MLVDRQASIRSVRAALMGLVLPGAVLGAEHEHAAAEDVGKLLASGKIWSPEAREKEGAGTWSGMDKLTRKQLLEVQERLEVCLETGRPVPGGEAGARMMLRALRVRLGANRDLKKALQLRACCLLPKLVEIHSQDQEGKAKQYRWTADDPFEFQQSVKAEMQRLSDLVYRLSWGKIALRYKVILARNPLSVTLKAGQRFALSGAMAAPVVRAEDLAPREATLLFLWIRTDGKGVFPPRVGNSTYTSAGFQGKEGPRTGLISVLTDKERLTRAGAWTGLGGGLPHELWHALRDLIKNEGEFSGYVADNHRPEDWEVLKKEIQAQGMAVPRYQYEDLYPTLLTWRMIEKMEMKLGRLDGWGEGPTAGTPTSGGETR